MRQASLSFIRANTSLLQAVIVIVALGVGCNFGSTPFEVPASSGGSSDTTTTTTTASTTSCNTTVLEYGQKGIVTAVGRGGYSDLKMIPGTSNPSIAYIDAGSLSIKFSYWNGTNYVNEVVSGDGTATFVRLAYLSSGVPLVFWAQGIYVKTAIRSAAPTSSGTWTAGVIDSGTAPRALEVSVNPLDQVGLVYLTDSAVGGRVRFAYCDAPCSGASSFQTMVATPYIENTNLISTEVATGMAWCKASASQYYPAVTYVVTGSTKYAVCQNTLTNCLTNTNWSIQQIVAVGAVASKLLIDSSVTGDVPKAVLLSAGIIPYKMDAVACTAAPAAFSAGAALGGASSGTQWIKILKDSPAGKFHIAANEAATSVRYYNSQTTDFTGAWNTAGIVETIGLAATAGGSADVDDTTTSVNISYGTNAAPFTLRIGKVLDYTVASNLAVVARQDPDTTGSLQLAAATSQQATISIASTAGGRPAVAYVDFSVGAVALAKLTYAYRDSASSTSTWSYRLVPNTQNPQFPSLAFDHNNRPWISYFDAANNRFYMATNTSADGSGVWNTYEFPSTPGGAPVALPSANQTAMAMYYSGGVAHPVMIITDTNAATRGLKASKLNTTTMLWSSVTTIDALTASGASHLNADFDTNGNIVAAYRDLSATKSKYVYATSGTSWSTALTFSGLAQGMGVTVRINPATTKPAAAYFDRANNGVYYASCTGTIASCASSGWSSSLVDNLAGVSGLAAGNEQLLMAALSFNSSGTPYIYYPRGATSTGSLTVADNSSGSFSASTLYSGTSGNITGSTALNFGISGWGVNTTRNAVNGAVAAYIGPGNWLYVTSCGD